MADKNLPIKLFHKRTQVDERRTEGGGGNTMPDWAIMTPEQFEGRVVAFKAALDAVSAKLLSRDADRDFIPAVVQLELHEDATAKSHRADIAKMFDVNSKRNLIGLTDEKSLLVKVENESDVLEMTKRMSNLKNIKGVAAVTELTPFQPKVEVAEVKEADTLRVSLMNYQNFQLNNAVSGAFERMCRARGIQYKKANYSPELIIYRLSNVTTDTLESVKQFEALESVSYMPRYTVTLDNLMPIATDVPVKTPDPGKSYPVVGILDTGIQDIPHLKPWLLPERFSKIPDDLRDPAHGTFVAGIVVYGDELEGNNYVGSGGCMLYDATVHPGDNDDIHEDDLIEHIREVIDLKHGDIHVWNMSLGSKEEADANEFSYFGKSLDQIQERYNVLICKSAGNCINFMRDSPVARISKSADSVRALVVGSIAQNKGAHDLAEINHPSPFSRIGKAPANLNKPELTHYGGNAGKHPVGGRMVHSGVKSFSLNGSVATMPGTSFSTPRVTALIAELDNRITEEYNPLLLKALAIHSAKYPSVVNMPNADKIKALGYGVPANADDILFNDPHEITLILQDTLIKGQWIEIPDFPFPQELIENGVYYGEIIATLVTSPLLNETQGPEYCQSNVQVRLGTYDYIKRRPKGKTIINEWGLEDSENVLNDGLYAAKYRREHMDPFARERVLINYRDKYHPIKKYAVNLNEMTVANKVNLLTAPKKWFLQVNGLFREAAVVQSEQDGTALSQDFCLVVTVRDSLRKHKVYDLTTKLLNDNGFLHSNISLRGDIRLRLGGNGQP